MRATHKGLDMMFRKTFLGLASAVVMAGAAYAETLGDALVGAYNHSGLLEQNRALLRAADEDVAIAVAAVRPVLNWSAGATRDWGTSRSPQTGSRGAGSVSHSANLSISAELTVYDFGRNKLAIDVAKETVLAARQALLGVEQDVLLRAVSAFFEVRRASETVSLRRNNLRLLEQELRAARDRFEVGEVTRTDVALAESRLALARSELATAEGQLAVAAAEYQNVVGRKPGALVSPKSTPKLPGSMDAATNVALRSAPGFLRAQHEVKVSELNVARAEASMKPRVTLEGRLSYTDDLEDRDFSRGGTVTLGATGPIYQGGALTAQLRQAIARRDAEKGNLHVVRHGVRQDVQQAYANLSVARANIESSDRQIRAARIAFQGVREEATLGARTTLDVLDAEQELLNAQARRISAVSDEFIAAYSVLASMGLLTAENLKLGVKRYDPAEYYNLVKDAPHLKSKQGQQLDRVLRALGKN